MSDMHVSSSSSSPTKEPLEEGAATNKSRIWAYFLRNEQEDEGRGHQSAKCKECGKVIRTNLGSTSGLHSHSERAHGRPSLRGRLKKRLGLVAEDEEAEQGMGRDNNPRSGTGRRAKQEGQCFICAGRGETKKPNIVEDEEGEDLLQRQLTAFNLVHILLGIPLHVCSEFLSSSEDNPGDWFVLCRDCKDLAREARSLSEQIQSLMKKRHQISTRIMGTIIKYQKCGVRDPSLTQCLHVKDKILQHLNLSDLNAAKENTETFLNIVKEEPDYWEEELPNFTMELISENNFEETTSSYRNREFHAEEEAEGHSEFILPISQDNDGDDGDFDIKLSSKREMKPQEWKKKRRITTGASRKAGVFTTNKSIWTYYLRKRGVSEAKCKECGKVILSKLGSTSGLHSHSERLHGRPSLRGKALGVGQKKTAQSSNSGVVNDDEITSHNKKKCRKGMKNRGVSTVSTCLREGDNVAAEVDKYDGKSIWYYYLREGDHNEAKCKECGKVILTKMSSTTGLHSHSEKAHGRPSLRGKGKRLERQKNEESRLTLQQVIAIRRAEIAKIPPPPENMSEEQKVERREMRRKCLLSILCAVYNVKEFPCASCNTVFSKWKEWNNHVKNKICQVQGLTALPPVSITKLTCEHCFKNVADKFRLEDHIRVTHLSVKDDLSCKGCSEIFKYTANYQKHYHTLKERSPNSPCISCALPCPYETECPKTVRSSEAALALHVKVLHTHTPPNPYKCIPCDRSFSTNRSYETHLDLFHRVVRSICEFCGKELKNVISYRKHVNHVHHSRELGAVQHHCKVCGKVFHARYLLLSHEKVHSESRPYSCSICSKTFKSKSALNCHMVSHNPDKRRNHHNQELMETVTTHQLQSSWALI